MVYQSVGRNQKSKGLKVKHAFQVALLLVTCIWFVYEIKSSHYKLLGKNLKSGTSTTNIGRKGKAGSNESVEMDIHDGNIIQHSDENGVKGDAAVTEEMEEESLKHEDLHDKDFDSELKEDKELGKQPKKALVNEMIEGNAADRDKVVDHDEKDDTEDTKELQSNVESITEVLSLEMGKESKYDTEEAGLVHPETESSNITDPRGSITGVNGFQDENGIPPDGHESVTVFSNETRNANLSMIMVEEVGRGLVDKTQLDTSRVKATVELVNQTNHQNKKRSGDFLGKLKSVGRNKTSLDTSSYNSSQPEVFKSENADKFRKSEINGSAEMTQEGNIVIEVSNSVHSQHETKIVSTI